MADGRRAQRLSTNCLCVCVCVCVFACVCLRGCKLNQSASSITIFSVLLRLMSFLLFRRVWLSSMSMMRMSGMVPPPRKRMVKSTMMIVVVPMSCRFSMGSRPRWRLRAYGMAPLRPNRQRNRHEWDCGTKTCVCVNWNQTNLWYVLTLVWFSFTILGLKIWIFFYNSLLATTQPTASWNYLLVYSWSDKIAENNIKWPALITEFKCFFLAMGPKLMLEKDEVHELMTQRANA